LLRRRLAQTGRRISIGEYAMASFVIGLIIVLLFVGVLHFPPAISLLFAVAGGFGFPHIAVGFMTSRRLKAFTGQFPDAIDLIVRGLKSGLPVSESIRNVGNDFADPVGHEFREVGNKLKIGQTLEAALWESADNLATPEFRFFVISVAIQRETGGNLAETLENLSDLLRRRRQMQLKIRAMSSEGKASAAILGSLPFMMLLVMLLVNPT
jgi:tight adherence protein B